MNVAAHPDLVLMFALMAIVGVVILWGLAEFATGWRDV